MTMTKPLPATRRRRTGPMRIVVRTWPSAGGSAWRTYAEYRVFLRLSAMAAEIAAVYVVVRRDHESSTRCAVTTRLKDGARLRARSERREPSRAIDAAVDEAAKLTSRRLRAQRAALGPRGQTARGDSWIRE